VTDKDEILFDVRNGTGFITLNRPQVLNALTMGMVRAMNERLEAWATDPAVRAVAISGAGGKAFCSGGDVKTVAIEAKATGGQGPLCREFFREEYTLNHRIHAFPKPYIALIDGIVMGGGKGLSAHGSHRVVTENITFAMPETNIGFFPDVGGGYFLPRCPGQTGTYLALTSARIGAADAAYIGFATHFVPAKDFTAFTSALEDGVEPALKKFSAPFTNGGNLAPVRGKIDRCFGHDRMEEIIASLEKDGSDWARETLKALGGMSPTSLKIALRHIRLGAGMGFAEVMKTEYRISQHLMGTHDFYEGIRAALIDKDRSPKWNPASLSEVSDSKVESFFESLGPRDLTL
jgi:enoyl-CoA hydratase